MIQPSSTKMVKITYRVPDPGNRQVGHHCGGIRGRLQTSYACGDRSRRRHWCGPNTGRQSGRSCGRRTVGSGQQCADAFRDRGILIAYVLHYLKNKINAVTPLLNVKRKRLFQELNIKGKDGRNKNSLA
jgi:hypothetical protein